MTKPNGGGAGADRDVYEAARSRPAHAQGGFPLVGLVTPERMQAAGAGAQIHLAILDHAGTHGLIGRGFYEVPIRLFAPRA